jgi:hypothetical protein
MFYLGLDSLNSTPRGTLAPWFAAASASLAADAAPDGAFIAMQLGLELPLNGGERRVADGELDNAIEALRFALVSLARPVFLRIGYEFNGPWNNYSAPTYVQAFRRIAAVLHADKLLNSTVALVWDGSCDTKIDPTPFWPGVDVVDWQGVNLFTDGSAPVDVPGSCVDAWLTDSAAAGLPLMIGESTPRGLFTDRADTLDRWVTPYLNLLTSRRPGLFSYIDENWEAVPRWKGWGDSRIETATPAIQSSWGATLARPEFLHRMDKEAFLAVLGIPGVL